MDRPTVGVSACLAGEPTRYDGVDQTDGDIVRWLGDRAAVVPLCPEVGAGMPVPRPPIHLVDGGDRAVERDRPAVDVTDALRAWFEATAPTLATLDGVVLKARSPSCGIDDAPTVDGGNAAGLFVRWLRETYPDLPMIDENGFADSVRRDRWWGRVVARNGD